MMCSRRSNHNINILVPDISHLEIEFRNSLTALYARLNERRTSIEALTHDCSFSSCSAVDEEALITEQLPPLDEIDRALTTWNEEHRWLLSSDTAGLLQAAGVENSKQQEMIELVKRRFTYPEKEAEKGREFAKGNRKWLADRDRT
jgi:hypothetical protein